MGTDRDPVPTCKAFGRSVVVLFMALYFVYLVMEPLSFDSPAENDLVRRFHTSAKVFVSVSAGTRTQTT